MLGMKRQFLNGIAFAASRPLFARVLLCLLVLLFISASAQAQYFAYVTNSTDGTVSVIDTATNSVVATVPVGTNPQSVAVTPDGTFAYIANFGSSPGTVSVINTATDSVAATIPVGNSPDGVAIAPNGTFAYVSNVGDNTVSVIDTFTNSVTATITLPDRICNLAPFGCEIVFFQRGAYAYVAGNSSSQVAVINTATNTVAATINNSTSGEGTLGLSADRSTAYAPLFRGYVSVINTATSTPTATWSLNGGAGGINLGDVVVTPDNATVYIAAQGHNNVIVVPAAIGNVSTTISVGSAPSGLAMTPNGAYVYVTNFGDGTVSVIQVSSNAVVATVPVGQGPFGVAIATPRDYALLNGGNSFNGNQQINGNLSATNFVGNGAGLTSLNASTLGGVGASNYARLDIGNLLNGNQAVNGSVTATTFYGDGSNLSNITAANANFANTANMAATAASAANASMLGGQLPSFYATTGANSFTATQTIAGGSLALDNTNPGGTTGVITLGGNPFIQNYGSQNTFVGQNAGNFTMTGHNNTASGYQALSSNTTGITNTASGWQALVANTSGFANTATGAGSLPANMSGTNNTANGASALESNTTGSYNTALGAAAGYTFVPGNANTSGSNNTFLGFYSGPGSSTQLTNATAIGSNAVVSSSNALVLGSINGVNDATASVNVGIGTATPAYALDVEGGQINASGGLCVSGVCWTTLPTTPGTVTSVATGAGLTGGPITSTGTVSVANGGITNGMLAANSVTSADIVAGTIVDSNVSATAAINPTKINGTAATLGTNIFTGTQGMPTLNVSGIGYFNGGIYAGGYSTPAAVGLSAESISGYGVTAASTTGIGVYGGSGGTSATTAAAIFNNFAATNTGNILLGQYSGINEFTVDAKGDVVANGAVTIGSGTAIKEHLSILFSNVSLNIKLTPASPNACTVWTQTFGAASDGDTVEVGMSSSLMSATVVFSAWASNGSVNVRFCNPAGSPTTLGTGNIRVDVWKH